MPEIKKFRLGGAAGYSLVAYGSKTRSHTVTIPWGCALAVLCG